MKPSSLLSRAILASSAVAAALRNESSSLQAPVQSDPSNSMSIKILRRHDLLTIIPDVKSVFPPPARTSVVLERGIGTSTQDHLRTAEVKRDSDISAHTAAATSTSIEKRAITSWPVDWAPFRPSMNDEWIGVGYQLPRHIGISQYKLLTRPWWVPGIWKYTLWITCSKGSPAATYYFTDETGATYRLMILQSFYRYHYVGYNSKRPSIQRVGYEVVAF